ncbi:MAG: DUF11 domain-containing protein [Acidimicrobiia bacterium]
MRRRHLLVPVLALVVATGLIIPLSLPASATINGTLVVGSNAITAGNSTSATATFAVSPPVGASNQVEILLAPVGATTGTASLSLTSQTATPALGVCVAGASSVVCPWAGANNGASATIVVSLSTSSDASGTWRITSRWSNNQGGPTVIATQDVTVTAPPPSADLSITKVDSPDPVLPGATLTYTLGYANNGPNAAVGVQVLDTLPAGVTFDSATSDQGTCSEAVGVVTCAIGALAAGAGGEIDIVVTVDPDVTPGAVLTNNATISATSPTDPDTSNNGASASTTVPEIADLGIDKSDDVDPVLPGAALTYTIGYVNFGPSVAAAVQIVDTLPGAVTFVSASPDQGTCSESAGVVTCDIGSVGSGSNGEVTIDVTVSPSAVPGSVMTNNVTISMDPSIVDLDPSDNSTSETTTIQAVADMSISKSDDVDPAAAGTQLTYTIEYDNLGLSDATGVTVVDTLPGEVIFVSATPDQGSCSETAGVVTCDLGDVAAAAAAGQIVIVVDIPADTPPGTISNTAAISSDIVDQVPANDTTVETTQVVTVADLSIGKEDAIDPVMTGGQIVYTLTYENLGPSDTTGVQVVDTLPASVDFVSATPDQGSCGEAAGTVTCDLGALSVGDSGQIIIVVDVPSDAPEGTISNTATISSDGDDPEPGNDSAVETTTVGAAADLSVTKVGTPDPVTAGDDLTYTITYSNAGPSFAIDVVVTDTLPTGVTYVSATPDSGTCAEAGGVVTCQIGNLAPGSGGSTQIVVTVPSDAPSVSMTNDVTVSSSTPDPTPGNNAAVAAVEVLAEGSTTTTTTPSPPTTDPSTTTSTIPSTTTTADIDDLPFTGQDTRLLAAMGLSMLLLGLLVLARRRPENE